MSSEPYEYSTLRSSRSIRLLKFSPRSAACTIVTVEVEKAPPFVALSYTWGTKIRNQTLKIQCEDEERSLAITQNLFDALSVISKFATERLLHVWADLICMNQEDIEERSAQVRLMGSIYRSAEIVGIWLGRPATDNDLVFDEIARWRTTFESMKIRFNNNHSLTLESLTLQNNPICGENSDPTRKRFDAAFHELSHRKWWERAWIVQEATAVSGQRTLIFSGTRHVDWVAWRIATDIWDHITSLEMPPASAETTPPIVQRARKCDTSRKPISRPDGVSERVCELIELKLLREGGYFVRLLKTLNVMRLFNCEDPRDKVFAALGMAMDIYENDIIPDYTKSCAHTFEAVVYSCFVLPTHHCLDVLGYVAAQSDAEAGSDAPHDLPSWVPDWRLRSSLSPFDKYAWPHDADSGPLYNATDEAVAHIRSRDRRLFLTGSILDHITQAWPVRQSSSHLDGLSTEKEWRCSLDDNTYVLGGTTLDALDHIIVADAGYNHYATNPEWSTSPIHRDRKVDWDMVESDESTLDVDERLRRTNMLVDIKLATWGRRLFQTSKGLLGLGPAAARIGDQVCVLLGGSVLYALRPSSCEDGTFRYVGECYVHKMMDGKAMEDEWYAERGFVLL